MSHNLIVRSGAVELMAECFGAGPPLVFAHGLTGSRQGVKRQFALLAAQYRIIVYDQRGHGASTPVFDPEGYDVSAMADDMAAVMDAYGVERAVVGGESMGAATTLAFALRYPERVERLLLTAPAFGDAPNTEIARFLAIASAIESFGMERFLAAARQVWQDDLGWPHDVIEYVGSLFASHNEASLVAAIRGVMPWTPLPDPAVLRNFTRPTCIISWDNDPLHPAQLAQRLAAALPYARLVNFAPLPAIFQRPQLVGDIYERFLKDAA